MKKETKKVLTYKQIRKIIIEKCIEQNACGVSSTPHDKEFGKLIATKTEKDFWEIIKINALWAHNYGVISVELFEKYDLKKLNENHIFIDGGSRDLPNNTLAINYNGTVSYNGNNGTVSGNYGTVSRNYGTVSGNYGTVSRNYGTGVYIERQNKKIFVKKGEF